MIEVVMVMMLGWWLGWVLYGKGVHSRFAIVLVLSILPIHALADVTTNYFPEGRVSPGDLRVLYAVAVMAVFAGVFRMGRLGIWVVGLLGLGLVASLFSSDPVFSLQAWIKFAIPIMLVLAGQGMASRIEFRELSAFLDLSAGIVLTSLILAQVVGLGERVYGAEGVFLGGGVVQITYVLAAYVAVSPAIIRLAGSRRTKIIRGILVVASVVMTVYIFRRGAVLSALAGLAIFMLFSGDMRRIVKIATVVLFVGSLAYPWYAPVISQRIEARGLAERDISDEMRYREVFLLAGDLSDRNVIELFFGKEAFNSADYYKSSMYGRPLHIDYSILIHSMGFVGMVLYVVIYGVSAFVLWRWRPSSESGSLVRAAGLALIAAQFVMGLSGTLSVQASRSIIMIIVGYAVGTAGHSVSNGQARRQHVRVSQLSALASGEQ